MVLLVVIAGLGFAAVQFSLMGERSARNDRDYRRHGKVRGRLDGRRI